MGSSSYPGEIDSDVELPRVDNNITEIGADAINSLKSAVLAIEKAIGTNPQGSTASLVIRINSVIDPDGNIKTSALEKKGLVTLPISNSQIGDNAGIAESKLDLNVGTTSLQNQINSAAIEVGAIRTTFTGFIAQTIDHFNGLGNRHDGYQIDLTSPIRGTTTLEAALSTINNAFTAHENSVAGVHAAIGISVNDEFQNISATDVQGALVELDNIGSGAVNTHQDALHETGIALNERGESGEQGNLIDTTLAATIFQTNTSDATQILQVMRPNVARVTSKNMDLAALEIGVAQRLRVAAGGVGRDPLSMDLGLFLPTDNLDDIVEIINIRAQRNNHYPISAYNIGGKLTIAHNIPGKEFTIQIRDDVNLSAATALGFGDVINTTFDWSGDSHAAYVGGKRITDLKSLIKISYTHTNATLNILPLGLGNLSQFGLSLGNEGRVLVNITNHSTTPTDNGTHYITSYPTSSAIALKEDIQNGTFDLEIASDSVNFENTANGEIFDIFIGESDGYGTISKSRRVAYSPLSGITPRTVSRDFPAATNLDWRVADGAFIRFIDSGTNGDTVTIPTSFEGQLKVFHTDNVNSALFEVSGVPASGRKTFNTFAFGGSDDLLHVASVHYSGNFGLDTLKFVTDKRRLGTSTETLSEDKLDPTTTSKMFSELRNNGVIRGFDVISSTQEAIKIRGGTALVDGRLVDVPTKIVDIDDLTASQKLMLLDRDGNYIVRTEFDSGFTFEELTTGDSYGDNRDVAILFEFAADGQELDSYFIDRRLFVGNVDKRLVDTEAALNNKIQQLQNTVEGSSWGFTIAAASGVSDGYLAGIELGANNGFTYIPSGDGEDTSPTSALGFIGGTSSFISTRRFEFSDPDTFATSIFKAVGMTHINVFIDTTYTGVSGGPFGVSGRVSVNVGVGVEVGADTISTNELYSRVKLMNNEVLPSDSVQERHVVSLPIFQLGLADNTMFDVVPRVKITNSTLVDGGGSIDEEPTIRFDNIRIVTSSYSIAGSILEEDGASRPLTASIGDVL